jgi:hypothetical protein
VSVLTSSLASSTAKLIHDGCDGVQCATCQAPIWQIIIMTIKSSDNIAEARLSKTHGDCAAMSACLFLQ